MLMKGLNVPISQMLSSGLNFSLSLTVNNSHVALHSRFPNSTNTNLSCLVLMWSTVAGLLMQVRRNEYLLLSNTIFAKRSHR